MISPTAPHLFFLMSHPPLPLGFPPLSKTLLVLNALHFLPYHRTTTAAAPPACSFPSSPGRHRLCGLRSEATSGNVPASDAGLSHGLINVDVNSLDVWCLTVGSGPEVWASSLSPKLLGFTHVGPGRNHSSMNRHLLQPQSGPGKGLPVQEVRASGDNTPRDMDLPPPCAFPQ